MLVIEWTINHDDYEDEDEDEDEREIMVIIAMLGVAAERIQILSEPSLLVLRGTQPLPMTRVSSWSSSG
jgi:HSP20 family molecular chaperone IbpA